MSNEEVAKILEDAAAQLGEHFEAVQILVSWRHENGKTSFGSRGLGNWYARQGMAREFIECDRAETQAAEVARALRPEE